MTGAECEAGALRQVEAALLAAGKANARGETEGPLFILGSPRTGSTILYQALVAGFGLPYLSNLTNAHFSQTPIVGLSIQAAWPNFDGIRSESSYGKIPGLMQPSEGSSVMQHWFGGEHPSEVRSAELLPGRGLHMQETVAATFAVFGRPLVIKNAWNCFRIPALAALLRNSAFVWIRRDIVASAASDLAARYATKGDPKQWNSATPRNIEELRRRPYWEQVVENQVEFARAISGALAELGPHRCVSIWYEDLCRDPAAVLGDLSKKLKVLRGCRLSRVLEVRRNEPSGHLDEADRQLIEQYVLAESARLGSCRYECSLAPGIRRAIVTR